MLVCNCRGLNERQVNAAIRMGVNTWRDVHACYGTEPSCGKCSCEIRQAMIEYNNNRNTGFGESSDDLVEP